MNIDTSRRVSSEFSANNVQMEVEDTSVYLETLENFTTQDEFLLSDTIESPHHIPTADNLQNTTFPTLDTSI